MKIPRLRPKFSLRWLMLLILVLGLAMGWRARRASLQRRSVAAIEALRGSVVYDWQSFGPDLSRIPASDPPGPVWLRRFLGDEYFQDVAEVALPAGPVTPPGLDEDMYAWKAKYERPLFEDQLACLDGLDRIESLWVQWGRLERSGLSRLARQRQLKDLTLIVEPLDAGKLALLGDLPGLESLSVVAARGDGGDLAFLDRLPDLRSIQILQCPVTDAGLWRFRSRDRLESLYIDGTKLTDAGLSSLEGLKALTSLTINSAAGITDAGLTHLDGLTKLGALAIPSSPITDAGLEHFRNFPKLKKLRISKAKVSDGAVEGLRKAMPSLKVYLH